MDIVLLQPFITDDSIQAGHLWAGLLGSVSHSVRRSGEKNTTEIKMRWNKSEKEQTKYIVSAKVWEKLRSKVSPDEGKKFLFMAKCILVPPLPSTTGPPLWLSCFLCQSIIYSSSTSPPPPNTDAHPHIYMCLNNLNETLILMERKNYQVEKNIFVCVRTFNSCPLCYCPCVSMGLKENKAYLLNLPPALVILCGLVTLATWRQNTVGVLLIEAKRGREV